MKRTLIYIFLETIRLYSSHFGVVLGQRDCKYRVQILKLRIFESLYSLDFEVNYFVIIHLMPKVLLLPYCWENIYFPWISKVKANEYYERDFPISMVFQTFFTNWTDFRGCSCWFRRCVVKWLSFISITLEGPCHAFPVITHPLVCYEGFYACKRCAESQTLKPCRE